MGALVYVSVDLEASGPVPGLYNLVSIGACPVVRRDAVWRASEERFYVELQPICDGFDAGAMAVHGLTRAHLEARGTPAERAMRELSEFVKRVAAGEARVAAGEAPAGGEARGAGGPARAVFVGHNAAFDWSFIAWYYERFRMDNPFGYKALDTKSLAMGRLGIDWFDTSKENLETLLRLPRHDAGRAHRADYDALYQAWILAALLNLPALPGR